ncbi:MAG: biotin/lipoyl-containing protein [Bacteroidia bacterium]
MKRKIGFSLVYRDMWQSSGKYMPRAEQLAEVGKVIADIGCFDRVESNGGGFEQIQLLAGENPNKAVRAFTAPLKAAGIQTHMLERGLNGIRMNPVPRDVRELFYKVKKAQGTDIARSFDGLNDTRNLALSIQYAKAAGMTSQSCLCITHSELHTVDYYLKMTDTLVELGTEEICIKDMAGIGRPVSVGKIIAGIKAKHPNILVQYHGHAAPGFAIASSLEAARAGADIIDVGMEPLSYGTGHPDLLTIHAMLEDAGFDVKPINMEAYMQARSLSQKFIDDWLHHYIAPSNRLMNALLIAPGLPGGMMGSLMADLKNNLASLNKWFKKNNKPEMSQDALLIKLFDEVTFIWPKMGFPPLVTPFSQYVKNVALMNVIQMEKGRARWSLVDDNTWDMLLGKSGRLPGEISDELKALAKEQGREFFIGDPQDLYPDALDEFKAEMDENGWAYGEDDEELFELAMHPAQYRNYRSGTAKEALLADIAAKSKPAVSEASTAVAASSNGQPKSMNVNVNGSNYRVTVSYGDQTGVAATGVQAAPAAVSEAPAPVGGGEPIASPLEGTFYLTKDKTSAPKKVGDKVAKGEPIAYIEAMKVYNAIAADRDGTITWLESNGKTIDEDDIIAKIG